MAKKKATKKDAQGKVPDMKSIVKANKRVRTTKATFDIAKSQSRARKDEYEGAVADLTTLIQDVERGQAHLFA